MGRPGGDLRGRIKLALVGLAYVLPVILVIASVGCVIGFFFMGAEALDRQSRGAGSALAALGGTGMVGAVLVPHRGRPGRLHLYLPAALVRVVLRGELAAGFEFGSHFAFIRHNLVNYLLSLLFYFVANFALAVRGPPLLRRRTSPPASGPT